jgi:hypothetical protein
VLRAPGLVPAVVTNFAYLWMVAVVFDTLVPLFVSDVLGLSTVGIGVVFAVALALIVRTPETLRPAEVA